MKRCPVCNTAYPTQKLSCDEHHVRLIETEELEPGTIVRGKFEIQRVLGQGGMGIVYQARNIIDGRIRALKFLSNDSAARRKEAARFLQEAQIDLHHPNIVQIYDTDQADNGSFYIVMEFVDGGSLEKPLEAGSLSIERSLSIAKGVALGLAEAHSRGILHRDVKPSNILIANGDIPKLSDFGIAAVRDSSVDITATRGSLYTPLYASPEQITGLHRSQLDSRVDIYLLGGVLFHMLTGRPPFDLYDDLALKEAHMRGERTPPSRLRPELAQWSGLDSLVLRALAADRKQRHEHIASFLIELESVRKIAPQTVTEPRKTAIHEPEVKPPVDRQKPEPVKQQASRPAAALPQVVEREFVMGAKLPNTFIRRVDPNGEIVRAPWMSQIAIGVGIGSALPVALFASDARFAQQFPYFLWICVPCLLALAILGFNGLRSWQRHPGLRLVFPLSSHLGEQSLIATHQALTKLNYGNAQQRKVPIDVYCTQDGEQRVISYLVKDGIWKDPLQIRTFTEITRKIAPAIGGLPIAMQFADRQRRVQKSFLIR